MYRDSSTETYHESDDDLPFDMESWSESEDNIECSRPSNPLPKILNEGNSLTSGYSDVESPSLLSQKRVRGESLDGVYFHQLTSSGERWQFQKYYLPPQLQVHRVDSNMFSQSYIVPVTDPSLLQNYSQDDKIIENFQDLDLLDDHCLGNHYINGEPNDHCMKKSRIGSQSNLLKSVENIEIVTHKRKKCQQYDDDEFSHLTHWDL